MHTELLSRSYTYVEVILWVVLHAIMWCVGCTFLIPGPLPVVHVERHTCPLDGRFRACPFELFPSPLRKPQLKFLCPAFAPGFAPAFENTSELSPVLVNRPPSSSGVGTNLILVCPQSTSQSLAVLFSRGTKRYGASSNVYESPLINLFAHLAHGSCRRTAV